MADKDLSPQCEWVQIRREVRHPAVRPIVRIRRSGDIGLSADFVRHANIADCLWANVYISRDGYRLGLAFHNDDDQQNSFQMCKDGGSGSRRHRSDSRVLQASAIKSKSATFAKLITYPPDVRTFLPRRDVNGVWVVELIPCFENRYRLRGELSPHETGIYRYLLGGETVYIGRGVLASRFAEPCRGEWQFDAVEYSVLNDANSECRWESFWLERFRLTHNRWPVYNRIGGATAGRRPEEGREIG